MGIVHLMPPQSVVAGMPWAMAVRIEDLAEGDENDVSMEGWAGEFLIGTLPLRGMAMDGGAWLPAQIIHRAACEFPTATAAGLYLSAEDTAGLLPKAFHGIGSRPRVMLQIRLTGADDDEVYQLQGLVQIEGAYP